MAGEQHDDDIALADDGLDIEDVEVEPVELDDTADGDAHDLGEPTDTDTPGEPADAVDTGDGDEPDRDTEEPAEDLPPSRAELDELAAERDQYKGIAQRVQADFDNYRKRAGSQRADEIGRATARLAEALLPVLDATEAAYVEHPDEVGPLFNLLLAELKKQGLEPIHLLDQPFDPNLAEAVAHESGAGGGDVIVAEVLRSGYTWNGRTLRPAMVRTKG